ncbi:hypothetical protein GCM10025857_05880 [Alicyclobacillus contaminans]|uniref:hypothetical protein n=1 Tax=Alicyclobacillus contaminans TaxID=392016 RepID=UPI0003F6924C|nr:hypothetical protein [Alicyclobacillus contaminans]GMA49231.1 hypothetical protein GCM10025857_05880 [Alicyclobacillus contaminans]
MKMVSIREFRDHSTDYFRSKEPLLVMRGSKPAGVYLPWDEALLPSDDLKRILYDHLTKELQKEMADKGISEEEVMADLEAHRKGRH